MSVFKKRSFRRIGFSQIAFRGNGGGVRLTGPSPFVKGSLLDRFIKLLWGVFIYNKVITKHAKLDNINFFI
jgi:hypothetical protein